MKKCAVVNSGFVAHYATLENDMQRRQVRAFLLKSFKSPACKHPEFSRMNDASIKGIYGGTRGICWTHHCKRINWKA